MPVPDHHIHSVTGQVSDTVRDSEAQPTPTTLRHVLEQLTFFGLILPIFSKCPIRLIK